MTATLNIGIDLDGVVYDFADSLRTWLTTRTGRFASDMPAPTCWEFYATDWGLTHEQYLRHCHFAAEAGHLFRHGQPLPGALQAIRQLDRDGHRLHIVTDRRFGQLDGRPSRRNTLAWLDQWNIPWTTLSFSADKTIVRTDMFIDDRPSNIDALCAAGTAAWLLDCGRTDQTGHPRLIPNWDVFMSHVNHRANLTKEHA